MDGHLLHQSTTTTEQTFSSRDDDGCKEPLDILVDGDGPEVVVHGLGDAIAMGGQIVGQLAEVALAGQFLLDGLEQI